MSATLLILAIVAGVLTAGIGILVNFANMMSDAPGVQIAQWPIWTIGGGITVGLLLIRHYG